MRTALLALSLLFVAVTGCGVDPPSVIEASQLDDLGAAAPSALSCPQICGEDTLCQLPSGVCQEACNACLCKARGGKVVTSCPAAAQAEPPTDDIIIGGGACGKTTCQPGTHCCNASCGVCVGPGGVCTDQICQPTD